MDNVIYSAQNAMAHLSFSRMTAAIVGVCAFIMMAADAALNYAGAHIMAPGHMATAFAIAAFVAVVAKFFWLSTFAQAIRVHAWHVAVGALIAGVLLHSYSILSAMGLASVGRDEVMSARGDKQEAKARALETYTEAKARVDSLAGQRPSATVSAAIAAAENELKVAQSREADERKIKCGTRCEAAMVDIKSAEARLAALKGDLALSVKAEKAQIDLIEAKAVLATIVAPKHIDPLAAGLAIYLPASVDTVSKGIPLLPTLIVEFVPGILLMIAVFLWGGAPQKMEAEIRKPSGGIAVAIAAPPRNIPDAPLMLPPAPLSPEEMAYRKLRHLITQEGGRIPAGGRAIAKALSVPHSSMAAYLIKWDANGRIVRIADGKEKMIGLPIKAKLLTQRELQTA